MTDDVDYEILIGDCRESLRGLADQSVNCCITSPPYFGLHDYGVEGQLGLEPSPDEFVSSLVSLFREVRRVLRYDGTLWLNLGDSYLKSGKQLLGIPWRTALALQADGWILRQDIIWHKPNPMPESVRDRCTKSHEYIFLFAKSDRYHFDHAAIKEPALTNDSRRPYTSEGAKALDKRAEWKSGQQRDAADFTKRNKRNVWSIPLNAFKGAHFATFPPKLIEPCVLAGCPVGGTVLDPFGGSGTTAGVAIKHGRNAILCELNPEYAELIPAHVASISGSPVAPSPVNDKDALDWDEWVRQILS